MGVGVGVGVSVYAEKLSCVYAHAHVYMYACICNDIIVCARDAWWSRGYTRDKVSTTEAKFDTELSVYPFRRPSRQVRRRKLEDVAE